MPKHLLPHCLPWLLLLSAMPVAALDLGGRIKLEANASAAQPNTPEDSLGYRQSSEADAQLRLNLTHTHQAWGFDAAWQLDSRHGSGVTADRALATNFPGLQPYRNDSYWDMDSLLVDGSRSQYRQTLDRLSLSYSHQAYVARLGRQALTWGAGQVFHPMDLVNPFQPVATDTAYKPGTDMAYLQWLLDSGADMQFVVVPHQRRGNADADAGKPTQALFASLPGERLQWTFLLANDRSDSVLGLGASGALGESVWNLEIVPTQVSGDAFKTSALFNITQAGTLLQRNITAFAEFYHNGFGEAGDDYSLSDLNPTLSSRLQRGQQFVTGRNYLALGATLEWTPLLQLTPTLIANLQDHSILFDTQASWSLQTNLLLKAGLRLPIGSQGSEFGGLQLAPNSGLYAADPRQIFLRLEAYF